MNDANNAGINRLAEKLLRIVKQMETTGDWRLSEAEAVTITDASKMLAALSTPNAPVEPTPVQVNSACLSYRHDFGLLSVEQQNACRFMAREWLRAWQKEGVIRKDDIYLVWSNEHSAWWGPNRAGYNTHISHAGRYTREEAIAICVRARGGREFNSNPSEVPIPLKDAEAFWTEDGLEERYRRESRERKEEYEREEIEAAQAIRNGGKQP